MRFPLKSLYSGPGVKVAVGYVISCLFLPILASGATRTSSDYKIKSETINSGGLTASSENYKTRITSEPLVRGTSVSLAYEIRHGFQFSDNGPFNYYREWASRALILAEKGNPDDDSDGDLIDNLLEYALGLNPQISDGAPLTLQDLTLVTRGTPTLLTGLKSDPGKTIAVFTRREDFETTGLTYVLQVSDNLRTWETVTHPLTVVGNYSDIDLITVDVSSFFSPASARFLRLTIIF